MAISYYLENEHEPSKRIGASNPSMLQALWARQWREESGRIPWRRVADDGERRYELDGEGRVMREIA